MLRASPPARFTIPFADSASGSFIRPIPQASQIGITAGAASLTDGFPPLNFQPIAAGGVPPFGQDFNGLLNQITGWSRWFEAGAPILYDATFATGGSGGYPNGAIIQSSAVEGNLWMSTADNNTTDPDSVSSANWVPAPGSIQTGTPIPWLTTTPPVGYVATGTSIGSAASGANRASTDTILLYRWAWTNFSNSFCPVSGGRGANPDADFTANKTLTLLNMNGTGVMGLDGGTTRLSGIPLQSGSINTPGSIIGENVHTLLSAEVPATAFSGTTGTENAAHTHNYIESSNFTTAPASGGPAFITNQSTVTTGTENQNHAHAFSGNIAGSGGTHNNVQFGTIVNWVFKL